MDNRELFGDKEVEDWLKKCMNCSHSYKRKRDDDEVLCRRGRKGCHFHEYKKENKND